MSNCVLVKYAQNLPCISVCKLVHTDAIVSQSPSSLHVLSNKEGID